MHLPAPIDRPERTATTAVLFLLLLVASGASGHEPPTTTIEQRIHFYSQKVAQHPRLSAAHVQLAVAYLDKAREDHDSKWLDQVFSNLTRSIEIQPNFPAFKAMAAASNFAHDFAGTLEWARLAAEVNPADSEILAMRVEAFLGLGRPDDALKLLPPAGSRAGDFHTAAARALWFAAQSRHDESLECFLEAAELAQTQGVTEWVVWAWASAAGALLDAGRLDAARSYLEAASKLDPGHPLLRLQQAELVKTL